MARNGTNPRSRIPVVEEDDPTDPGLTVEIPLASKILAWIGAGMLAVATAVWGAWTYLDRFETERSAKERHAEDYVLHRGFAGTDSNHEGRIVGLERSDAMQEKQLDWLTNTMWEFAKKEGLRVPSPPKE
jgi:hypothetical protein